MGVGMGVGMGGLNGMSDGWMGGRDGEGGCGYLGGGGGSRFVGIFSSHYRTPNLFHDFEI